MTTTRQQIRFCTASDGVRIALATSGKGPPLVRVGGWMAHLEFDWVSPVWQHWMTELSRNHLLVRYDARGCGLSDWQANLSFEAMVGDLETVVDALGLERFPLFAMSQGASVAVAYAARHPEKVSHLVIHGGYARGWLRRGGGTQGAKEAALMVELVELGWGKDNPAFWQFFTTQFIPGGTPEQVEWFNELERRSTSPENAAGLLRVINDIDVTSIAPKVSCPTLVLHSTQDARVPFDEGRLLASLIPDTRFVPLESRNHILLSSEPAWMRWIEEFRRFLPEAAADAMFGTLTPRERELVELIAQGLDNLQVAAHLGLSEKTVRNNITSIFSKLQVDNRSRLIVLARNAGFGSKPQ